MALGVRAFVAAACETSPPPTASAIASGLEQGLRETPLLIAEVASEWRKPISLALKQALIDQYPEFLEREEQRLQKVIDRGSIRTEAEFHLVRHHVDLLEGCQGKIHLLQQLYLFLEAYEARA